MKYVLFTILILLIVSWFAPIIPTVKKVPSQENCITLPGYVCYEKKFEWKTLKQIFTKDQEESNIIEQASLEQENKVTYSNAAHEEFLKLRDDAQSFHRIDTVVEETDSGKKLCDNKVPVNCITIEYSILDSSWINPTIYFFDKPVEQNMYVYEQIGDMPLVVEYLNEEWVLPDIAYLENAEISMSKIANYPYAVYERPGGDGGWMNTSFLINSRIQDFPYWVQVVYAHECCSTDEELKSLNYEQSVKEFVDTLRIIK